MDLKTQLETVAKNHQSSIQNLETKFDRIANKQSGRPSGSLPSNIQPNPRDSKANQPSQAHNEHANAIFTRSGSLEDIVRKNTTKIKYLYAKEHNIHEKDKVQNLKVHKFETYVKSKDLDLWHVITNDDFQPIQQNPETKLDEVIPFERQSDDLKKKLAKNNEAKMVIYNALPKKEYERIFMCNTAKEIWKTLLITHQGNSQVKDNQIDLLVQQYEQLVISEDETIDSAFARFNTIITSLKALDEGYSS
ncbi:hypothetical protein Tco_0848563 [Tanacetum coccineum]